MISQEKERSEYKILKLNNLTFIFSPFRGFNTACLGIFLKVGARYEKKKEKGIAHFLEHILFKGSENYSYKEIKREIEGRGGMLNGFTSQETTGYYAQFLNKNIKITLDILWDMVTNPLFDEKEIEKERKVILEEIKMHHDFPATRSMSLLEKILWKGHPLGEEVIGSASSVERIGRKELIEFKEQHYIPSNMVICCVGDFEERQLLEMLREKIEKVEERKKILRCQPPTSLKAADVLIERRELDQTHLCVGFRAPSYRSKERLTVELLHTILGANMSSRLFEELRERKALCYEISTEIRRYKDSGAFVIHLGVDKGNIVLALREILKELKKIKEKEVPKKELERAKDFLLGQILMSLEKPQGRMFHLSDFYIALGKIYTVKEIKEEINKINTLRIKMVANKIFLPHKICVSCVGKVEETLAEQLKKVILRG